MAKEAIREILEAEDRAREMIRQAKEEADAALAQGRRALSDEVAGLRREAKQQILDIHEQAEQEARAKLRNEAADQDPGHPVVKEERLEAIADHIVDEVLHYGDR